MTDAYGGHGGIAQYNRDLLGALNGLDAVDEIEVLPRQVKGPLGTLPAKVRQRKPPRGRAGYLLASLGRSADIVFCGHINLAPVAAMAARLSGAKLVMQFHGVEAWETPSPLLRRSVEQADLVLCVSRYTRARVLTWSKLAPEKVVVLSNTVSEAFSPGDRAAARARLGLGDEPVLLTVGRLDRHERYKGHEAVIAALPEGALYLVAGDGDDLDRVKALAEGKRVRFLGQVSREMLPDLYRAADLFVMPSTGEGFGIVFLEAMASGVPALGLAVAGATDALADGEAVSAEDFPAALARRLAAPAPDRKALAARVRARFGRPVFERRATDIFNGLT